eukprot:g12729.t1
MPRLLFTPAPGHYDLIYKSKGQGACCYARPLPGAGGLSSDPPPGHLVGRGGSLVGPPPAILPGAGGPSSDPPPGILPGAEKYQKRPQVDRLRERHPKTLWPDPPPGRIFHLHGRRNSSSSSTNAGKGFATFGPGGCSGKGKGKSATTTTGQHDRQQPPPPGSAFFLRSFSELPQAERRGDAERRTSRTAAPGAQIWTTSRPIAFRVDYAARHARDDERHRKNNRKRKERRDRNRMRKTIRPVLDAGANAWRTRPPAWICGLGMNVNEHAEKWAG